MMRRELLAVMALAPVPLWAQTLPPPVHGLAGRLRLAGTPGMAGVAEAWAKTYEAQRPGVRVALALHGSDVAMAGLYTATCDIALIGREATKPEIQAFEWIYRFRPTGVPVLRGSAATPGQSPALAVMVHRDNPVGSLRLEDLRAAFGDEGRKVRRWGDLGLGGIWGERPVNLHAPEAESGTGRFFRAAVLGGSNRMAWPRMREYPVPPRPEGAEAEAAQALRHALARDAAGLGVGIAGTGVRSVPLVGANGNSAMPDAASVRAGLYPLARTVMAYHAAPPNRPVHAETLDFLRFLLTPEAQAIAAGTSDYLPLPAGAAQEAGAALG